MYTIIYTQILVHITIQIVVHEKSIITIIKVCIHKYKYSYTCMYTQIYLHK